MQTFRKPFVALALAVVGSLAACTVAVAESASGSGATFPQNFLASATVAYNAATGDNVTYANPGGGSSKGKAAFKAGLTDFGGTDSSVTSAQAGSFDWIYVPYVAGPIAIAYRLDELKGQTLSLSPATINGIFGGTIRKWNDPSIANDMKTNPAWANSKKKSDLKGASSIWATTGPSSALITVTLIPSVLKASKGKSVELYDNTAKKSVKSVTIAAKGQIAISAAVKSTSDYSVKVAGKKVGKYAVSAVNLPNKPIIVVYRSDGSGTTNNFCNFMKNGTNSDWVINDAFTSCVPGGSAKVASFGSTFQGQSGSANLSNYVAENSGTIGYAEASFVTDATRAAKGMQSANVKNAAGKFVGPTAAGSSAFIAGASIDAIGFVTFNFKQTTNSTAYPIVAVTYGLGKTAKSAKNAVVSEFFTWVLNTYAPASADALGYAPLTGAMKDAGLAQAKKVNSK
ncbi:MAG: substrate-binding domain-containing protein [Acidimicrobiaceae bacterium]|nr:substrate-binding domain-containing protein [Acidimicrobiaceae bacterium]